MLLIVPILWKFWLSKQWDLLGSLQPPEGVTFYFERFSFSVVLKCWGILCWEQKSSADVNCWHIHRVLFPGTPPAVSNTKVWKVTKNRTGMWVMLSQTREIQAVFHMRFLNCSQSCLFWIGLHVGILIQLLLLESSWRELLSFHLRKLSGLDWTMLWLPWPGVGSRWGHLQGSLSRNSSVSCDYGPSLLKILNCSVKHPNFYDYNSLLKLGCWKWIVLKVGLFHSVL